MLRKSSAHFSERNYTVWEWIYTLGEPADALWKSIYTLGWPGDPLWEYASAVIDRRYRVGERADTLWKWVVVV